MFPKIISNDKIQPMNDQLTSEQLARMLLQDDHNQYTTLADVWNLQQVHWQSELERYKANGKERTKNEMHLRLMLHLSGEIAELVQCADWKIHAKSKPMDKAAITYEAVDVFKFLLNLLNLHEITLPEFVNGFAEKSLVVCKRVKLEQLRLRARKDPNEPWLVCDIDGVLAWRDGELLKFINDSYMKTHMFYWMGNPPADAEPPQRVESLEAWKAKNGQRAYEGLKASFYEDAGFSRCVAIKANVNQLLRAREDSSPILLVTSRDVKRYPRIEFETHEWLERNEIPYDAVVFASEKERAIDWIPRTSRAADDELEHVRKLSLVCVAHHLTEKQHLSHVVDELLTMRTSWRASAIVPAAGPGGGL